MEQPPRIIPFVVGESIELKCVASGQPDPEYVFLCIFVIPRCHCPSDSHLQAAYILYMCHNTNITRMDKTFSAFLWKSHCLFCEKVYTYVISFITIQKLYKKEKENVSLPVPTKQFHFS